MRQFTLDHLVEGEPTHGRTLQLADFLDRPLLRIAIDELAIPPEVLVILTERGIPVLAEDEVGVDVRVVQREIDRWLLDVEEGHFASVATAGRVDGRNAYIVE